MNKQLFLACFAASILVFCTVLTPNAKAQNSSPTPAPPEQQPANPGTQAVPAAPAAPIGESSGILPTSYPHHYLDQHIALTETSKTFYATRQRLGCSFAPGSSDLTITTAVRFVVDQDALAAFITKLKPRVDCKSIPAHPVLVKPFLHEAAIRSDNVPRAAMIVPFTPAVTLLMTESADVVGTALGDTPQQTSIPLSVETASTPYATAPLDGIDARLSHFVTHFNPGEVGRTVTVRRAIQLVDGTILQPGEIFSINRIVGERTLARGFGVGKVFINGTMANQVGGGMCQVATTLFNAALLANLNIVERHQHVRTVPYVPAGGDATVYYGEKDFQFQNNTAAPLYIYYKTYGPFAVCDLYGIASPESKVRVVTIPTKLGPRYYKGVIRRYVTADGKTTNNFTAYSTYKWTPSLDYLR